MGLIVGTAVNTLCRLPWGPMQAGGFPDFGEEDVKALLAMVN